MVQRVIWGKLQYRIWNPHRISKLNEKKYSNRSINKEIGLLWFRQSFELNYNIRYWISIKFPSKKKIYSNWSINKEIGLLWSRELFEESTILDLESPSNFHVKEKKLLKSVQKERNYALIKNARIVMFKMDMGRSCTYYRVFLLFTRYLIAKGIIPESLSLIG